MIRWQVYRLMGRFRLGRVVPNGFEWYRDTLEKRVVVFKDYHKAKLKALQLDGVALSEVDEEGRRWHLVPEGRSLTWW